MQTFEQARKEQASSSRKTFTIATLDQQPRRRPELKLDHLFRMTDSTGILQHATFSVPNFAEGYCTDDNSRALIFSVMLEELGHESERVRSLATTYIAFLHYAFNRSNGRFRNFMGFDWGWLEEMGSEDSHGRALWALGYCIGRTRRRSLQELAARLFGDAVGATTDFVAPRAWAYTLLGIDEYLRRLSGDRVVTGVRQRLIERLMETFTKCASEDWAWCEEIVTYDNAKLPHALIRTGDAIGQRDMVEMGLRALRWLAESQTAEGGWFRPIGNNGFYPRGGRRAAFDQQPIEAQSMVSAGLEAHRCTEESEWHDLACRAFDWFLGRNDLGVELHSSTSGGCYDALHVDRVNRNQGAESLLAFLLSRAEMDLTEQSFATSVQTASVQCR